jgi:hypothetical protein
MNDVRNYYRDYVKQKNLDKYLLNNATVTSVRRICCSKQIGQANTTPCNSQSSGTQTCWEVTGIIDKRDRKKASSLTHKGDLMEFRYFCKHLIMANGATDLHNELHVKGEKSRFVLKSLKELEDKIKEDLPRLLKDPLLIVGSGLSAADAILLAQKHHIRIVHVIRRSVNDSNLVFNKLPKKVYPEYTRVYEQMLHNRYSTKQNESSNDLSASPMDDGRALRRPLSQNDLNTMNNANFDAANQTDSSGFASNSLTGSSNSINSNNSQRSYVLYDEHQVKYFTSKRTCVLTMTQQQQQNQQKQLKCANSSSSRHIHLHKHQPHRHLNEFDEEVETAEKANCENDRLASCHLKSDELELKISYACILVGFSPDLDFLPPQIVNELAVSPNKPLDTKDNPICINPFTHESSKFKSLYAMGPLIGDNFVRFGTGGALAITASLWNHKKNEEMFAKKSIAQTKPALAPELITNQFSSALNLNGNGIDNNQNNELINGNGLLLNY